LRGAPGSVYSPRSKAYGMRRWIALAVTSLTVGTADAGPPKPEGEAPRFPAGAELVVVDAVVVDEAGRPMAGLGVEDFTVLEDGRPQPITSFEAAQIPAPRAAPRPATRPRASTNVVAAAAAAARTGRAFVVVFDELSLTAAQAQHAKQATVHFLKQAVGEGDRVSVVATGSRAWWTARMEEGREELAAFLERLQGRYAPGTSDLHMSDYEAMRVHVFDDTVVGERVRRRFWQQGVDPHDQVFHLRERHYDDHPGLNHPMVRSRAAVVYREARERIRETLAVVERALRSLAATKGRKSLVLVSKGFVSDPKLEEFKSVLEASRRSNAAIYFLDARGLVGGPTELSAEWAQPVFERDVAFPAQELILETEGSESLALESGGFSIKNTNDLASGIERIASESRTYYLLGYKPAELDGRYHKLAVKVRREGLEVRARAGYYAVPEGQAPKAAHADGIDPELLRVLDAPFESPDIPLSMTAYVLGDKKPGEVQVLVAADMDVRDLAFERRDGRFTDRVDLLLVVTHRESGRMFPYDQTLTMELLPQTREQLLRDGYSFTHRFELPPGTYQARLVVRDGNGGRRGSVAHTFAVPALGEWRVSTPVLSDRLQNTQNQREGPPRPAITPRRSFPADSTLFCGFDVYGAAADAATGHPSVSAGYELRGPDGRTYRRRERSVIAPGPSGEISRLMGVPLEGYPAGEYELVLTVRDEVSGRQREQREPFRIEAAEAALAQP
jgi:VWFA-related protein